MSSTLAERVDQTRTILPWLAGAEYALDASHRERHALLGIDCDVTGSNGSSVWYVLLNTGGRCRIGGENQLHGEGEHGEPYVELPNGLTAQITRAAWYRLINAATIDGDRVYITSQGKNVDLGSAG